MNPARNINIRFLEYFLKHKQIPKYTVSVLCTVDGGPYDQINITGDHPTPYYDDIHTLEKVLYVIHEYVRTHMFTAKFAVNVDVNNIEKELISETFPQFKIER